MSRKWITSKGKKKKIEKERGKERYGNEKKNREWIKNNKYEFSLKH